MKVLIDSDALFALYVASDIHHPKAKQIFKKILDQSTELIVSNLVIQETATVMSYRFGQAEAKNFLKNLSKIDIRQIFVNEKISLTAWEIFRKQNKKGTSFVDCANIAICQAMKIDKIFSFDRFYRKTKLNLLD